VEKQLALIVEDNPQLNKIFSIALAENFETLSFDDGDRALKYLAENAPQVIILDLNLPGTSGQQILSFVRSQPHLAGVRVILATADAARADELSSSADLVLLKPISPIQLIALAARISKGA
jgi:DNA-binding response OmpR family regulator